MNCYSCDRPVRFWHRGDVVTVPDALRPVRMIHARPFCQILGKLMTGEPLPEPVKVLIRKRFVR